MAVCPKCQKKIPFYHLGQLCPHCGVNVRFYNFDKNFYKDAKRAELSVAKTNIFIAHIKAALIGSKLSIVRLVCVVLPLASLLAPYAVAKITQPFVDKSFHISALGLYQAFSGGLLNYIMAMIKGGPDAPVFNAMLTVFGCIAVEAVISLLILVLTLISFLSIKKMPKVLFTLGVLGALVSVAAAVLSFRFSSVAANSSGTLLSGNVSFGYAVSFVAFCVVAVLNMIIIKKGYNIVYKEGDLERAEIAKKVKKGEISLDDLPQPIVETEETRQIDEEIARQQALYHDKEGGAGDEEN